MEFTMKTKADESRNPSNVPLRFKGGAFALFTTGVKYLATRRQKLCCKTSKDNFLFVLLMEQSWKRPLFYLSVGHVVQLK